MKSAVPAPAVLTLLFSRKSKRTFPTTLVSQACSASDEAENIWDGEVRKRFWGGNLAKAIQTISCRGRMVPYIVLKGISSGLPTAPSQTLSSTSHCQQISPLFSLSCRKRILLPPCLRCFCLIFSPLLALFTPTCAPLGPSLHCCALTIAYVSCLPHLFQLGVLNQGGSFEL